MAKGKTCRHLCHHAVWRGKESSCAQVVLDMLCGGREQHFMACSWESLKKNLTIWDQCSSRNSICSPPLPSSKMGYLFDLQENIKQGPLKARFQLFLLNCTAGCLMAQPDQGFQNPWKHSIPIWSNCLGELSNLVRPSLEKNCSTV